MRQQAASDSLSRRHRIGVLLICAMSLFIVGLDITEGEMPVTEFPSGGLGAGFAPEEWAGFVLDNLGAASVLLASGATEIRTAGKTVHAPRFTGDAATNWYAELEEIGEGCPPGDELVLTPKKIAALCTLSNEVVDDANANVLDSVGTKMVRSVALAADKSAFCYARGAHNWHTLQAVSEPTSLRRVASHTTGRSLAGDRSPTALAYKSRIAVASRRSTGGPR